MLGAAGFERDAISAAGPAIDENAAPRRTGPYGSSALLGSPGAGSGAKGAGAAVAALASPGRRAQPSSSPNTSSVIR